MAETIEVKDFKLSARLSKFALALSPPQREIVNRQLGIQLLGITLRNFDRERGEGRPWARLKPATKIAKAKKGYSRILQNTGALRQSFLSDASPDQARVYGKSIVGKGDKRPPDLAKIHQFGAPARKIPARPMLPSEKEATVATTKVYNYALTIARQKANI